MTNSYSIETMEALPSNIEKEMREGFISHEKEHGKLCDYKKFTLVLRDKTKSIMGVLHAYTVYAEVYVEDLWVSERSRKKGYGRKLLKALEDHFKGKGFHNINLVTSAFQAPGFYPKCGFIKEFVRENKSNPQLTKTFFIKYFDDEEQTKGLLPDGKK